MESGARDAREVRRSFEDLADAEGDRIPVYASLSRAIARHPELHGLLLEAPVGQRLPVLLLAALHDVVLRHPDAPIAPWYPTVTPPPPPDGPPDDALRATVELHRDELLDLLRHRQVQTNEVNRCVAWWIGLRHLGASAPELSVALVELGTSAGLNLRLDDYAYRFDVRDGAPLEVGRTDSAVRLGTQVRTGPWPELAGPLPPIATRVGLDRRPVDVTDPDDARWLRACVWPEQPVRQQRLAAALEAAAEDPPLVVAGDLVHDVPDLLERCRADHPGPLHLVLLSSWVLAYISRPDRSALHDALVEMAGAVVRDGGALTLLTLESDRVVPWAPPPPLPAGAGADEQHASILTATSYGPEHPGGATSTALARCQAHLVWVDRLDERG